MNFNLITRIKVATVAALIASTAAIAAESSTCVLRSDAAGTLSLTSESYSAEEIKVVGYIDARDFRTLKAVTMHSARVLDLSEATIMAYQGKDGCFSPLTNDWIVSGNETNCLYLSDYMPVHAFTEALDNSLYKYYEGSATLSKIILPQGLRGFDDDAFLGCKALIELVAPEGSTTIRTIDNVVYSHDRSTLLAVAPIHPTRIDVPATVTTVKKNALKGIAPEYIHFQGQYPAWEGGYTVDVPFVLCDYNGEVPQPWSALPRFAEIEQVVVENVERDGLLTALVERGYNRNNIHFIKVSGTLSLGDVNTLLNCPELYQADLSEATIEPENNDYIRVNNPVLSRLTLPTGCRIPQISLTAPHLCGDMVLPNGVAYLDMPGSCGISSFVAGSNLQAAYLNSPALRKLDLSRAYAYFSIVNMYTLCPNLEELALPANVSEIKSSFSDAPLRSIVLPSHLETLHNVYGWRIKELALPASLTSLSNVYNFPDLTKVDFSKCRSLATASLIFSDCPKLKDVDMSAIAAEVITGYNSTHDAGTYGALDNGSRFVVADATHYPAVRWSGVASVKFPPALASFSGFKNNKFITDLDLSYCYRLSRIDGLSGCSEMKRVQLPPTQPTLPGFAGCTALTSIVCASTTPPKFSSSPDANLWQQVTLTIPDGTRGLYAFDEQFSKAKETIEGGYSVAINTRYYAPIYGAGLYPQGSSASLYALPYTYNGSKLTPSKWTDSNGFTSTKAECTYTPTANAVISVNFKSAGQTKSQLSLAAPVRISNRSNVTGDYLHVAADIKVKGGDFDDIIYLKIYDDNNRTEHRDTWEVISVPAQLPAGQTTTFSATVPLSGWTTPGYVYEVRVCSWDETYQMPWELDVYEYNSASFLYKATSLTEINPKNFPDEKLRQYISTTIDIDTDGFISEYETHHRPYIAWALNDMDIYSLRGVEYFPKLRSIQAARNHITHLDLSHNQEIYLVNLSKNIRYFTPGPDGWTDLSEIIADGFDFSKATFVSPTDVEISGNSVRHPSLTELTYEYSTGSASCPTVTLKIALGDPDGIEAVLASSATATIYDLSGRVIASDIRSESLEALRTTLPSGIYIISTPTRAAKFLVP